MRKSEWLLGLVVALALCLPAPAPAADLASVDVGAAAVRWDVQGGDFERMVLTVSQPDGTVSRREFKGGQPVVFDVDAAAKDGVYRYELRGVPRLDDSVRRELVAARKAGNESAVVERMKDSGRLPREAAVQSGSFAVRDGVLIGPGQKEAPPAATSPGNQGVQKDVVNADDFIIQGSLCVGLDCVNNESFGFDTIRLKENNTRIKFDDTSTGTGFPANDWQLTANDSASGGSSKFSIEDITGARVPFTITAGASTNSIFVDSTGRVGLRTSTPVLDLHIATSNTPAIRLEQNNSGGFTAQTWDIAGNEANFFVRDVTGGSRLPFRIRPGAPTSSIDINASGDVGIGTASPSNSLHVSRSDGTAKLFVQESSGTSTARELMELRNNGAPILIMKDSSRTERWSFGLNSTDFVVDNQSATGVELQLNGSSGNMVIKGTLTTGSSRDIKTNFVALDPRDVLSRVTALPVSLWSYKTDGGVRHFGPVAEDFHHAFGLGEDDKHIAPGDTAGIALAAVQGLSQVVQDKDKEIADLKGRVEALEKLVRSLAQEKAATGPQ